MHRARKIAVFTFALLVAISAAAQNPIPMGPYIGQKPKRSLIRTFLNKFTLGVSTGYGKTLYSHKFDGGVGLIQKGPDSLFIFDNVLNVSNDTISLVHTGWLNNPVALNSVIIGTDTISANGIPIDPGDFIIDTDTARVRLRGRGRNTPIKLTLHAKINRYRVGGGMAFEFQRIRSFTARDFQGSITGFTPTFKRATWKKYFGLVGGTIYESRNFAVVGEAELGIIKLGRNWNPAVLRKGIFVNVGVSAEQRFSEILTVFFRPSFEFKTYTIDIPENSISINHNYHGYYFNFGVKLQLPELRRCPIKRCSTQLNHVHWGTEYRSRKHPFWKWQNPNYGENYKKLIKYKGKNKRKINPY